jgi:hypothetical protein
MKKKANGNFSVLRMPTFLKVGIRKTEQYEAVNKN